MKNMKKIFSALTSLGFVSVAGMTVVACGCSDKSGGDQTEDKGMIPIAQDLGIYDENENSSIKATLQYNEKISSPDSYAEWEFAILEGITASKLLDDQKIAKSEASYNYLIDTLGMTPSEEGETWQEKTFNTEETDKILLDPVKRNPSLVAITNDYAVDGGIVSLNWRTEDHQLVSGEFNLKIKPEVETGVVASQIPEADQLQIDDFDHNSDAIKAFTNGLPVSGISVGDNIGPALITAPESESNSGKRIKIISDYIEKDFSIKVIEVTATGDVFANGDKLTVELSMGTVTFATKYTLELPWRD